MPSSHGPDARGGNHRRGAVGLVPDDCTSCLICVRECPAWCISLTADRVSDASAGRRGRSRLMLTSFVIDYGLCMDCGICVDVCPTGALRWVADTVAPTACAEGLLLGIPALSNLLRTDAAPLPAGVSGAG